MTRIALCLLQLILVLSCKSPSYLIDDAGVTIYPVSEARKGKCIRLEPYSNSIVHVFASANKEFELGKSLMALPRSAKVDFKVAEEDGVVSLNTSCIHAKVVLATGEISFLDSLDNLFLAEKRGGGKSFDPITVDGDKAWTVRQIFESPDDEAFYGLGQHQSNEFNWKGRNEELFQYNTKVSVPFLLSSRNYGILWDNNSLSRFGDPRPYTNLNQFLLYDKEGQLGGLSATYVVNNQAEDLFCVRREPTIDYENINTVKNLPKGLLLKNASVVWEGYLQPKESGIYRFNLYYAGYVQLYVDDSLMVKERWRTAWNPNGFKFEAQLDSGKMHQLRLEWRPDGNSSYIGLKALSPVDKKLQNQLSLWSEMGRQIEYYFIAGENSDEVISGYRSITGKSPIMPRWAMGFWQSRERYKTQQEMVDVLEEFRARKIPIDNIVLDWNYWPEDAWGSHGFDAQRFPDPQKMVNDIHALNARMMISVWPKFYVGTEHYNEFAAKGWMFLRAVKDSICDWVGPGYVGSFYDAYSSEARSLFWQQLYEHLYPLGIDAWWMDASEPNVRDCTDMDYRKALCGPTALGTSTEFFNAYALMNAEAIYQGQRSADADKRVFLLTRSGFAGLQRYSTATWSGDIASRWEDMKAQIPAGINFSMSGIPYWTMDNGGFCVERRYEVAEEGSADKEEWRELNTRWHQFGAFVPLFRTHGQFPYREVWNIAPENHPAYSAMVYSTQLRYRLLPYIYSIAGWTFWKDYSLMRGLIMDFGHDANVKNIGDQYLFGPGLMVCPVTEYQARNRMVYLPEGLVWYDFYSGETFQGGQTILADAPLQRMPVFVPAGAIIPMGPVKDFSDQQVEEPYSLRVYAGKDGVFEWYNDEGTTYAYEKGECTTIPVIYNDATRTLILGTRLGSYPEMEQKLEISIVLIAEDQKSGVDQPATNSVKVLYCGDAMEISL